MMPIAGDHPGCLGSPATSAGAPWQGAALLQGIGKKSYRLAMFFFKLFW